MVEVKPSVGARIKEARLALGSGGSRVSQKAFAARLGTTRRRVIAWESGANTPSAFYLQRIATVTGRSVDFFLDGLDPAEVRRVPLSRDEFEMLGDLMGRLGQTLGVDGERVSA